MSRPKTWAGIIPLGSGCGSTALNFNAHSDILSLVLDLNRIFDRVNMMS